MALHVKSTGIDYADFGSGSGSMTSELLDDYEEGTFTPVLLGGDTGNNALSATVAGVYTKIGRSIHTNQMCDCNSKGSAGGALHFTGLPFDVPDVIASTSYEAAGSVTYFAGVNYATWIGNIAAQQGYLVWFYTHAAANGGLVTPVSASVGTIDGSMASRQSITYYIA